MWICTKFQIWVMRKSHCVFFSVRLHMIPESRTACKGRPTNLTAKQLLSSMFSRVPLKVWIARKCKATYFADVWFFSCMCPHMWFKMWILSEGWPAYFANKWLFFCVYSHMVLQMWTAVKCKATDFTIKWHFSGVYPHVVLQVWMLYKCRSTDFTIKRFFPSVCPHVNLELRITPKGCLTDLTWITFVSWVCSQVTFQINSAWTNSFAHTTHQFCLVSMYLHMLLQTLRVGKYWTTNFAVKCVLHFTGNNFL